MCVGYHPSTTRTSFAQRTDRECPQNTRRDYAWMETYFTDIFLGLVLARAECRHPRFIFGPAPKQHAYIFCLLCEKGNMNDVSFEGVCF